MKKLDNIKFICKLIGLFCAWALLVINYPIFASLLFIFLCCDLINCGPYSMYYELEWRYIKWKTKETEHTWGDWYMIDGGMRQIRFCKNCGKMDMR